VSTPDDLRRIALALPQAYEDVHRRHPGDRLGGLTAEVMRGAL